MSGFWQFTSESRKLRRADKQQNAAEAKRAIEAQKTTDSYNEVQKVDKGEKVSQQYWQQADDAHDVAEEESRTRMTTKSKSA